MRFTAIVYIAEARDGRPWAAWCGHSHRSEAAAARCRARFELAFPGAVALVATDYWPAPVPPKQAGG